MYFEFVIGEPLVVKKKKFLPDLSIGMDEVIGVL
jgi:hypothetical protein